MIILLVAIDVYFIRGYCGYQWLLYWCLLMVVILMIIGDYFINGY